DGSVTVRDTAAGDGDDGTDRVQAVESLRFADTSVNLLALGLDLVVAQLSQSAVSVLIGDGDGGFVPAAEPEVTVGDRPFGAALGDLDGDGDLDLVAINNNDTVASVCLGNGDGSFAAATAVDGARGRALALGDLDGDGDLDLVTAAYGPDSIRVNLGDGAGGFTAVAEPGTTAPGKTRGIALGDVDGDGTLDLLTANDNGEDPSTISVFLGDGDGSFTAAAEVGVGDGPHAVALGDLDRDGNLDLVSANGSGSLSVRLGDGLGGFVAADGAEIPLAGSSFCLALGDLDGDGRLDLVAGGAGYVAVLLGQGDGRFVAAGPDVTIAGVAKTLALGDLDGDGDLDLVAGSDSNGFVSIRLNDGSGGFAAGSDLDIGEASWGVALGDLDGDGWGGLTPAGLPVVGAGLPYAADPGWIA
ncbi:MAG: VCBS repeat-containing protein, partial [Geminicoccaceae bacterium]